MNVLSTAVGVAMLALLGVDIFVTVFHPQGHGGPLTRRQNRWLWHLFVAVGKRRDGSRREGWLALGGPVLALLAPISWMALLVVGSALIYLPHMDAFLASPGNLRGGLGEALYYSGYTAATLGLGDVVADTIPLRLLTVVQALGGFALITAALTYIVTVYREVGDSRALALSIDANLGDAAEAAERAVRATGGSTWDAWLSGVADRLLKARAAHAQFPILHYFRPADRRIALPVQLSHLLEFLDRIRQSEREGLADAPGYRAASRALETYVEEVTEHFIPERVSAAEAVPETPTAAQDLERILRHLAYGPERSWSGSSDSARTD